MCFVLGIFGNEWCVEIREAVLGTTLLVKNLALALKGVRGPVRILEHDVARADFRPGPSVSWVRLTIDIERDQVRLAAEGRRNLPLEFRNSRLERLPIQDLVELLGAEDW